MQELLTSQMENTIKATTKRNSYNNDCCYYYYYHYHHHHHHHMFQSVKIINRITFLKDIII
jgi:hypothetical protein